METQTDELYKIAELRKDTEIDQDSIKDAVIQILRAMGEDIEREGLLRTPDRVSRMYAELLDGYRMDPLALVNGALFDVTYDEMVMVRDIEFYSLCEHHMLPFFGRAHVAYLPKGRVVFSADLSHTVASFTIRAEHDVAFFYPFGYSP